MLDISFKESSLNSLYKKLDNIKKNLLTNTTNGLEEALKDSKDYALSQKRGSKDNNLILTELNKKAKEIIGRVYTNFSYAPFLEYGTGTYAEMPHIGHTATFKESGFRYWYLPVEKANREFSSSRKIMINGREFYIMYATQPYPFMRPTAFYRHDLNVKAIKDSIKEGIKKDVT